MFQAKLEGLLRSSRSQLDVFFWELRLIAWHDLCLWSGLTIKGVFDDVML